MTLRWRLEKKNYDEYNFSSRIKNTFQVSVVKKKKKEKTHIIKIVIALTFIRILRDNDLSKNTIKTASEVSVRSPTPFRYRPRKFLSKTNNFRRRHSIRLF